VRAVRVLTVFPQEREPWWDGCAYGWDEEGVSCADAAALDDYEMKRSALAQCRSGADPSGPIQPLMKARLH